MFLIFYFHFTNITRRQNHISFIVEAFGDTYKSSLAHFFLYLLLFFLCPFFISSFSFFFKFCRNLYPSSLWQHVLSNEETSFPSPFQHRRFGLRIKFSLPHLKPLSFHMHLAEDTTYPLRTQKYYSHTPRRTICIHL